MPFRPIMRIMPKLSDPEIIDLVKAIKRGEVDMTQGHVTLLRNWPWLEARWLSDDDYRKNFQAFWKDLRERYWANKQD